jgi:serine/threonine protein kinase
VYPQVFGKYVLERELARGGMARVVLATLRGAGGFEKKLVVKQIRDELACDDDFVRRFVEEAKTTVALAHPNIVPVYELGVELGTYFLAMEYVEGASLAELMRACTRADPQVGSAGPLPRLEGERAPMPPDEVAYVGVEVCRALDYAHRRMNVVHRDVTPRNVMVDEEGQVKVIDFGISAPVATTPAGHGVFGSPGHMPPEQQEGGELSPAADVFAVAVLLMEMWTGKPPFRRNALDAIDRAMKEPHPKPSDADPRLAPLDDVIGRAMSLDPRARPQQAEDLARALRRFLSGADLGDVARQLGARVRRVRASPPPPSAEKKPKLQRPPSRPSAQDIGTRTFAAREEVLPTADVGPDGGGTRKLESGRPPAESAGDATGHALPEDAGPQERGREIETVATRPIESGPREEKASVAPDGKRRSVAWLGVVGALAGAVGAFFLGKGAALVTPPAPSVSATLSATIPVTATTASAAPSATTAASTATTAAPGAPSPADTDPQPPASASTAAATAAEKTTVMLLGDGTIVSVDGVSRGAAPVRAALEPGAHSFTFSFPATGESKAATLLVKPGEHPVLRADFTGATPTIRVQR